MNKREEEMQFGVIFHRLFLSPNGQRVVGEWGSLSASLIPSQLIPHSALSPLLAVL